MAEPEDIILLAAERVSPVVAALWRRRRPTEASAGIALADVSRRLSVLIHACLGRSWSLLPVDPEAAPTWLAGRLRKLPPWANNQQAQAFSDGLHIFLPRHLHLLGDTPGDAGLMRLLALMCAVRLAHNSLASCPTAPIARDLFWAVDSCVVEDYLSSEFPGLVPSIVAARRLARASRPPLGALRPGERAVELIVRRVLESPVGHEVHLSHLRSLISHPLPHALTAQDLAPWATRVAARPPFHDSAPYRGVAPVLHWGRPRPDLLEPPTARGRRPESMKQPRQPIPSRRLPHRLEALEEPEDQPCGREGPFLLPHADPEQSVEPAAGLRRLLDQGEEPALDALAEELARLGHVSRVESDAKVQEVLEVEGLRPRRSLSLGTGESGEPGGVAYPEWDYRVGVYRQHYCLLRETAARLGDMYWAAQVLRQHHTLIRAIRRRFEALRPIRQRSTQQLDGPDLDLDAYVDDFGARRAGRLPTDRLYLNDRARRRDVAVALLVDCSGSTEAWISGGRRGLDLEKEATLIFCEALEALGDQYAVYAFASRGALDVQVRRVKGFTEVYGAEVCQRLAGLQTQTYTRLGAPIRHLTSQLSQRRSRLRLLFLLSDGKPNDEDEYEGPYGLEDTRQAVAEARLQGIHLFCLAIDRHGSTDLARMFGPHGYSILWDIAQLPQRLPELYRRLTIAHR
jgi:nitric oxide reductase NorD protein